jgi:hypothetical protein
MLKTTASQVFKNTARDINNTIQRGRKQKAILAECKPDMALIINVLRPLLEGQDYISIMMGVTKPQIIVYANNLESFKSGRIVKILQVLEAFGTIEKTTDWPSLINRDYKYDMPKYEVNLCAYVKEDSPTCRKIAIGSETQTVVKYAIQCD